MKSLPQPIKVEKIDLETGEVLGWFWAIPAQRHGEDHRASVKKLAQTLREQGVTRVSDQLRASLNLPEGWQPAGSIPLRKPHTLKALANALAGAPNVHATRAWEKQHGTPVFGRQFLEEGVPANPHRAVRAGSPRVLLDVPSEKDDAEKI